MEIHPEQDVMSVNNRYAAQNRALFAQHQLAVINILGSPGAGKTTLVERLLNRLGLRVAVIEGDLATAKDAARIAAHDVPVVQINTDGGCHLDAKMIAKTLPAFQLDQLDLLLIENVGNLVCPAGFDLGEDSRLVVLSVTEGADKPSKYPATFVFADAVVINKVDLLPYVDCDIAAARADIQQLKPGLPVLEAACRPGSESGLEEVAALLKAVVAAKRSAS